MNTNTLPAIVDRTWKFKKGNIGVYDDEDHDV